METLESIIHNQAKFVVDSGYSVEVNSRMDTVSMTHESGDEDLSIFLQGTDGASFIRKANEIWEEIDSISEEDSHLAEAKQYIENLI